ncbi:hypothetical protein VARIO8X_50259 [Burkholderiales bacterium 8X]|nr:hypothetical protein VARIO8X_50259 [Burkholderiales bacterium 8X]
MNPLERIPSSPPVAASTWQAPMAVGNLFFSALASSSLPMLFTDPGQDDNPIVFCNAAFVALYGFAENEVIGRNCRFLQGPESDPSTIEFIRTAVAQEKDVTVTILNYRKDGSSFWNSLFISPIRDADGKVVNFFACQLDLTQLEAHAGEALQVEAPSIATLLAPGIGMASSTPAVQAAGSTLAAIRHWREMDRLATDAEMILAGREIARDSGAVQPSLTADRSLATRLRAAAVRARDVAFGLLQGPVAGKGSET